MPGYELSSMFEDLPHVVYSLVPRHVVHDNGLYYISRPECQCSNARLNDTSHMYCKAEFEMVAKRYLSLQHKKELLNAFVGERQQMSTDMIQVRAYVSDKCYATYSLKDHSTAVSFTRGKYHSKVIRKNCPMNGRKGSCNHLNYSKVV